MGNIGKGYGSEWLFRQWRSISPSLLDDRICSAIGWSDAQLEWIYPDVTSQKTTEPKGLQFLRSDKRVSDLWRNFWPTTGNPPNWDAIARDTTSNEWVLFECKANHPEFCSSVCGAKGQGKKTIEKALAKVKRFLGVHRDFHWLGTYYQYANRLACLYFLNVRANVPARLVLVYFLNDKFPDGRFCPPTEAAWRDLIRAAHLTLGLKEDHPLKDRVHEIFLPASPT